LPIATARWVGANADSGFAVPGSYAEAKQAFAKIMADYPGTDWAVRAHFDLAPERQKAHEE